MGATPLHRLRTLPLFWLSFSFLAGIIVADLAAIPALVWMLLAGVLSTLALLAGKLSARTHLSRNAYLMLVFSLVSACLGGLRHRSSLPEIDAFHIAWYNDREYDLLVTGWLAEPPDHRDSYTNLRLQVEAVDTGSGDLPVEGVVLVRTFPNESYAYGERLRVRGRLVTPPEDEEFSYREYLARRGIHAYVPRSEITRLPGERGNPITAALYAFKDRALQVVYRIYPDPEASLLAGILLGVETGLPADLAEDFKDTGTAHIIAISGFNITIIAGFLLLVFNRALGGRRGPIAAVLGIALYTFLVGADAAVVRAAIMGTLSLLARQVGRRNDGLNALLLSAGIMALFDPQIPWDVGFQLSFTATLGLILYAEPFQDWAVGMVARFTSPGRARKIAAPLSEYLLFTLAAQITTLPIMAYHFGRLSLVSLLANPFILPAQPAVMILGGLAVLLGLVWLPLGGIAAFAAWPFAAFTIRVVEIFARIPHGVIVLGDLSLWLVFVFYVTLLTWTFARARIAAALARPGVELPTLPALGGLAVLAVLVVLTFRAVFTAPDGRLHLTFLEVGSADAILLQTPAGRYVLVNGGPSAALLADGLGRRLPAIDRRLDWLVVASTQESQLAGLPRVMARIPPENVLWSGNPEASYAARSLDRWFTEERIPVARAQEGTELDLGDGARLRVAASGPRGAVLLLEWKRFRALLPVGMDFEGLADLAYGEAIGKVSLLLVGEAGYAPVNPPEWIAALNPQLAVLAVAADDRDGLPDADVLEALDGYPLLRTDQNGWIAVHTDGDALWIEVERPTPDPP